MNLNINTTHSDEKITMILAGKLDTMTAPQFQDALTSGYNHAKDVDIDFAELNYISSAGLRILLMGEKTAKAIGVTQTIVNVTPDVMEVFEITGFSTVLRIA